MPNIGLEFSNTFYQNTGTISIDTTVNEGMIIDLTSTFDNQGKLELHNANQTGILLQGNLNNSDTIIVSDNIIGNGILIDGGVYDNSSTAYLEVQNTDLNSICLKSGDFINAGKVVVNNAVGDGINIGGGNMVNKRPNFQCRI